MDWTVGKKIGVGYGIALLTLALLGVVTYQITTDLIAGARWTVHTYQVREELSRLFSAIQDAETGQRGYLIVGEDRYLEPYRSGIATAKEALQRVRNLIADNPSQQQRLVALEASVQEKLSILKETIDVRTEQGFDAALLIVRTDRGKEAMDNARRLFDEMLEHEEALLQTRQQELSGAARATTAVVLYGVPLIILSLAIIGYFITRQIIGHLSSAVTLLATSSAQIVATVAEVASGAAQTLTAVMETTTTAEEVKQAAQLTNDKAKAVAGLVQKTSQQSQGGRMATEEAIGGMQQIRRQMETLASNMVRLGEQTQAIGQIVATVEDLATQSNLLAVNAAIEAAKAGDEGKGFGVVAQEVKSLAEQSRQATGQVRGILGEIQKAATAAAMSTEQGGKAVDAGGRQVEEAGEAIRVLAAGVDEAAQAAMQIAASGQQQLAGVEQVATAMASIRQASAQNEAGAKQLEMAARNLDELGRRLKRMVGA